MGDRADLILTFGLNGLKSCFMGCTVDAINGSHRMTQQDLQDHMVKGKLRDMALAGHLELYAWRKPGDSQGNVEEFSEALDKVEKHIIASGGFEVIVGFSDGATLAYHLLNRLPSINATAITKTRMLVLTGSNDAVFKTRPAVPKGALVGVKLFHSIGDEDAGYCDSCLTELKDDYLRCTECSDFDICGACAKDMPAALAKHSLAKTSHTAAHKMQPRRVGDPLAEVETIKQYAAETGLEIVCNAVYQGGHKMPAPGQNVYTWIRQFYRGQL